MSHELVDLALSYPGLNAQERSVLLCLAGHHNKLTGRCFPKVETISKETGWCERTVFKAISMLKAKGLINVDKKGHPGRANMYSIHLSTPPQPVKTYVQDVQASPALDAGNHLHAMHTNQEFESGNELGIKTSENPHIFTSEEKQQKVQEKKKENKQEENKDIVEAKSPPTTLSPFPVTNDSKLVSLWKDELSKLQMNSFPSAAEGKMLRIFSDKIGYENALKIIPVVVKNWSDFSFTANASTGAFPVPKEPNIGFLLRCTDKAVDYYKKCTAPNQLKQKQTFVGNVPSWLLEACAEGQNEDQ